MYINNILVSNASNHDDDISYIRHLTTEVSSDYKDSKKINLAIHDAAGNFDSIVSLGDGTNIVNTYQLLPIRVLQAGQP